MTAPPRVATRCAAHPARLAVDACPSCARPRCGADLTTYGDRCSLCSGSRIAVTGPGTLEVAVRAGLAGIAAAIAGGWIATQHVNVHLMSLFVPALLGIGVSWATGAAAGRATSRHRLLVLAVAAVAAVAGTALGFRLFGRPVTPVHPWHQVGPPYLAALLGVAAWPVLFGPVRRSGDDQPETGTRSKR